LNSPGGVKGGLLLSSIAIDDLGKIPANELWKINSEQDVNLDLRGIMVYNTGTANVPRGIYVWNGYYWSPDGNCNPIITTPHTRAFTVYSSTYADLAVTADGCPPLTYTWYKTTEASTTGGTPVGNSPDAKTYRTPTGLDEGIHYYYCMVESSSGNVVATSDLFTVTVTCSGAIVFNGAYNGPSAGTYTTGLNGPFEAGWTTSKFSPQHKDLCWAATDISETSKMWAQATTECAALTTDGKTWRLPNLKELQVLYEALGGIGGRANGFTALNTRGTGTANGASAMKNLLNIGYWSSTEHSNDFSYVLYFTNGKRNIDLKAESFYARCVRSL
jgi:hypothetical protein